MPPGLCLYLDEACVVHAPPLRCKAGPGHTNRVADIIVAVAHTEPHDVGTAGVLALTLGSVGLNLCVVVGRSVNWRQGRGAVPRGILFIVSPGVAGAAKNGFTAYRLVLGEGQGVAGDGFVPIDAAFLDGSTTLTLDCYHSGGSADPWPLDDWYGAERNVDSWLGAVAKELGAQG